MVVDPPAGAGVTVTAGGVTISDLRVIGSANGIVATNVASLALNNVRVDANTGTGLNLTGTGAAATLTLTDVTLTGNAAGGATVGGFATVALSAGAAAGATVTATGTSVQVTSGGTVGRTITLSGASALTLTGGPAITVGGGGPIPSSETGTAGDVLDLTTTTGLTLAAAPSNNGFSGTVTSAGTATVNFSGIERFADGATISGRVTDQSSAGVANVTVQLDVGANGSVDLTTTTDAAGNFSFVGLPHGTYRVRVVVPAGATQTSPNPADFANVALGQSVSDVNFTLRTVTPPTGGPATGVVYADLNRNGVRDAGENGVRGVTVFLDLDNDGRLDRDEPAARTDTTGAFTLTTTQTGTFAVRAVLSPGYLRSSGFPTVTLTGGGTATADIGLFTNLPPQATPARRLAAGFVGGGQARVKTFGPDGNELADRVVFPGQNMRDVRVAVADVTGDGVEDVIVGTRPGVPAQVVILDGTTLQEIARLTPFEGTFTGGLFVAAGDVTGDGFADLIGGGGPGGGPWVFVLIGADLLSGKAENSKALANFFAGDDEDRGGVRLAAKDTDGDGRVEIITGSGRGNRGKAQRFGGDGGFDFDFGDVDGVFVG